MDATKPSGISLKDVTLIECTLGRVTPDAELKYHLGITGKIRQTSDDGQTLLCLFSFDLMKGIQKPPFRLTCSFLAGYSRPTDANMKWEEFSDVHALTHIIPFLREFVVNMTSRMSVPKLSIPPINAHLLIAEYQREQEQKASVGAASPEPSATKG